MAVKEKAHYQTSFFERLSYGLYLFGQNLFYYIVTTYTLTFLLNAGVSEVVAGTILLVPKIWDAVNDPIFGVIMDKVKFKHGRFIPWLRVSLFLIPLATIFLFSMPFSIPTAWKIAWVIIGYVLWDTGYTMCDAPVYALSTSLTDSVPERTVILTYGRLFATIGAVLSTAVIPMLYGENGANLGWSMTAVLISLVAFVFMIPICFVGKERCHTKLEESPTLKQLWDGLRATNIC